MRLIGKRLGKRHLILLAFTAVLLLAYFFPGKLWSASNPFFMPLPAQVIFWLLFLSLFFPETTSILEKSLFFTGDIIFNKLPKRNREITLFIVAVVFLWFFRTRHYLWGDSHMLDSVVLQFPAVADLAPYHFLLCGLFKISAVIINSVFKVPLIAAPYIGLWFWHLVSGGLYIVFISRIADISAKEKIKKVVIFLLLLTSGTTLVFTHYELYSVPLLFAVWGIYLFIKYNTARSAKRFLHIIPIVFAISTLPLFLPLLFMPLFVILPSAKKSTYFYILLFVPIFLYSILSYLFKMPFEGNFLPINYTTYFFSWHHLLTLMNFVFFTSPILLFLFHRKKNKNRADENLYLIAIASVVILAVLNLSYGGLDWDLAVAILFPLVVFAIQRTIQLDREILITSVGVSMLFIASWFYLNIDNRSGIAKAETILLSEKSPYLYTKSPQERLAQIYYYNIDRDKYADRLVHYSWWCIDNEQFSPRPYSYLAGYYTDTGKHEHAVNIALIAENRGITNKFIANLIILIFSQEGLLEQRKPEHIVPVSRDFAFKNPYITSLLSFADSSIALPATHRKSLVELYAISSIIAFFGEAGKFDEARNVFFAGIRLYPYSSILNLNWGSALLSSKDYSGAREQFFLALAKGGDRGKIMNNIALTYLYEGDYSMAEKYFLSAIDASPMVFDLNYNYALFLFSIGKKERAIEKMHDYIARAKYREQEELALGAIEYFNSKATSINK